MRRNAPVPEDTPRAVRTIGDRTLAIRPATTDEDLCRAILVKREYSRYLEPTRPDDVWLDVGANLGAFALSVCRQASAVVCCEPEPNNIQLLEWNLANNQAANVHIERCAVISDPTLREVSLFINGRRGKGSHTLLRKRGREAIRVPAEEINQLVRRFGVNKLKIDAEGIEYELLMGLDEQLLRGLREVIFEWHFNLLKDTRREMYREVLQRLHDAGFTRWRYRWADLEGRKTWHTTVWFGR